MSASSPFLALTAAQVSPRVSPGTNPAARMLTGIDDYPLDGRTHYIELVGPLDLYAAPGLKDLLLRAIDEGKTRLVVDLSAVSFIDSAALSVFVQALRRIRALHGVLALVVTDYDVERVFEITGLDRVVAIHRSRDAALDSLSEAGRA